MKQQGRHSPQSVLGGSWCVTRKVQLPRLPETSYLGLCITLFPGDWTVFHVLISFPSLYSFPTSLSILPACPKKTACFIYLICCLIYKLYLTNFISFTASRVTLTHGGQEIVLESRSSSWDSGSLTSQMAKGLY